MVIIKQGHLKREAKIEKYEVSVLFQIQNSIRNNPADLNSVFLLINKLCGKCYTYSVADPGFSPGGGANSQKYYYFSIFCRKLHENERIWTRGGGGARVPGAPPWIRQCIRIFLAFYIIDASNNRQEHVL